MMMTESKCEPEHFKGRIIFMSMYNDIDWTKRGNKEDCIANVLKITECARRFTRGHWSFSGPGSEKKWYGTHVNKLDGEWLKTAEGMMHAQLCRKRTSCISCQQRLGKEETWKAKEEE